MESFEYAIKKDVRNNPIVREVDEAREREQWKWIGIGGLLVLLLLVRPGSTGHPAARLRRRGAASA